MIQVGRVSIGRGKPKICASITEVDSKSIIAAADLLLQRQIDIVEWRIDFYEKVNQWDMVEGTLQRLKMTLSGKPLMVTFRTKEEGGNQEISKWEYEELLSRIAESGHAHMIDVEIFKGLSYEELAEEEWSGHLQEQYEHLQEWIQELRSRVVVVGSYHNFRQTPSSSSSDGVCLKL